MNRHIDAVERILATTERMRELEVRCAVLTEVARAYREDHERLTWLVENSGESRARIDAARGAQE